MYLEKGGGYLAGLIDLLFNFHYNRKKWTTEELKFLKGKGKLDHEKDWFTFVQKLKIKNQV